MRGACNFLFFCFYFCFSGITSASQNLIHIIQACCVNSVAYSTATSTLAMPRYLCFANSYSFAWLLVDPASLREEQFVDWYAV